jgi:hypothetical protein
MLVYESGMAERWYHIVRFRNLGKKGPPVLKEVHICKGLNCEAKDPILDF